MQRQFSVHYRTRILRCALALLCLNPPLSPAARSEQEGAPDDPLAEFRKQIDEDLSKELRGAFPGLLGLLAHEGVKSSDPEIHTALLQILEKEKTAPVELQPALLLVADQLAGQLWCDKLESAECRQLRDEMAGYGLTWKWSALGAGWFFQHDLLWRLQKEYATHRWSEAALVLLLDSGWDTSTTCAKGADQFREVIQQGERFLTARPASVHRGKVFFLVGQAYETWWSLSKAPKDDEYANAAGYQQGAQQARDKAIQNYEEAVKLAPKSRLAVAAQDAILQLKQGKDTNQRRFYCIYD